MAAPTYAPAPMAPATPSRPLGVAILAVLVGILGVLLILGGLLLVAGATALTFLGLASQFAGLSGIAVGAIVLIIGIIVLAAALGLWHLRLWALVLALILTFLNIVTGALAHDYFSFGFIFAVILFVYLLAVHQHFH